MNFRSLIQRCWRRLLKAVKTFEWTFKFCGMSTRILKQFTLTGIEDRWKQKANFILFLTRCEKKSRKFHHLDISLSRTIHLLQRHAMTLYYLFKQTSIKTTGECYRRTNMAAIKKVDLNRWCMKKCLGKQAKMIWRCLQIMKKHFTR